MLDRQTTTSLTSLESEERVEALQRVNEDLRRRLKGVEANLQARLTDNENAIMELQNKLEEVQDELSSAKREEKELRGREVRCLIVSLTVN